MTNHKTFKSSTYFLAIDKNQHEGNLKKKKNNEPEFSSVFKQTLVVIVILNKTFEIWDFSNILVSVL